MDYREVFEGKEKKTQNEVVSPTSEQTTVTNKPVAKRTEFSQVKFCRECGAEISAKAEICPKCGVRIEIFRAGSNEGFSFEKFKAKYIEKFESLNPFRKIAAGFLTSLFIAPILISIFVSVSSLISAGLLYGAIYNSRDLTFAAVFAFILILLGWIGAILIESMGFVMIVYGIKEIWREQEA
jgi:ribosomal protein L40E